MVTRYRYSTCRVSLVQYYRVTMHLQTPSHRHQYICPVLLLNRLKRDSAFGIVYPSEAI